MRKTNKNVEYTLLCREMDGTEFKSESMSKGEALLLYYIHKETLPFVMMVETKTGKSYF